MLATPYVNGPDYALAEQHLRAALTLAPADVPCNLCLAAVLLRRGGRESLAEIDARLGVVERTVGARRRSLHREPRSPYASSNWRSPATLMPPRRRLRGELLAKDADNESASKLLKTLGE